MDKVMSLLVVAAVLVTGPHDATASDPWRVDITEASRRFDISESWILAIIEAESGGDPRAVSPRGATGLMQLMPGTWKEVRSRHGLGSDPFDPRANILAGTAYLAELRARFGVPGAFAAYNAGPARYAAYLQGKGTLPRETRAYMKRIRDRLSRDRGAVVSRGAGGLFFPLSTANNGPGDERMAARSGTLFVPLSPRKTGRK